MAGEGRFPHAEQLSLGHVAVGDETSVEPAGTAGYVGDGFADPAAGAGFRNRQDLLARTQSAAHLGGKFVKVPLGRIR